MSTCACKTELHRIMSSKVTQCITRNTSSQAHILRYFALRRTESMMVIPSLWRTGHWVGFQCTQERLAFIVLQHCLLFCSLRKIFSRLLIMTSYCPAFNKTGALLSASGFAGIPPTAVNACLSANHIHHITNRPHSV